LLWWVMLHSMAYRAMAFNVHDPPHGFWSHSTRKTACVGGRITGMDGAPQDAMHGIIVGAYRYTPSLI